VTRFCPLNTPSANTSPLALLLLGTPEQRPATALDQLQIGPWFFFRAPIGNVADLLGQLSRATLVTDADRSSDVAGLAISKDHSNVAALPRTEGAFSRGTRPRVLYNLACAYGLFSEGLLAQQKNASSNVKGGLDSLALALWLDRSIGRKVREDNSLKACEALRYR